MSVFCLISIFHPSMVPFAHIPGNKFRWCFFCKMKANNHHQSSVLTLLLGKFNSPNIHLTPYMFLVQNSIHLDSFSIYQWHLSSNRLNISNSPKIEPISTRNGFKTPQNSHNHMGKKPSNEPLDITFFIPTSFTHCLPYHLATDSPS